MNKQTTEEFPRLDNNRVRRHFERAHYDKETVYAILDSAMLCHVAYVMHGQPFATPTIHWRQGDTLYWHGSSASKMQKHLAQGVPVCLTVSHLDGLVLARSAFHHSVNYRSVMCFGEAQSIDDVDEKETALHAMIERFYPGRDPQLRKMKAVEIQQTKLIKMPIESAVAKIRNKGVGDDEADLHLPIWAGVITLETIIKSKQPCPHYKEEAAIPNHIALYREGHAFEETMKETQKIYEA